MLHIMEFPVMADSIHCQQAINHSNNNNNNNNQDSVVNQVLMVNQDSVDHQVSVVLIQSMALIHQERMEAEQNQFSKVLAIMMVLVQVQVVQVVLDQVALEMLIHLALVHSIQRIQTTIKKH